jgi:hypothetical protein
MWYRVFASIPNEPNPAALVEHLHALGHSFIPHFHGDDLGWTSASLDFPVGSPVTLGRYLTKADELRNDLNAYAAELETMDYNPNNVMLMEKVIQTQQLFTVRKPMDHAEESKLDSLCDALVKWLAEQTAGIIQIDGKGWHTKDGTLLLQEY